jgi:hypothetical protein
VCGGAREGTSDGGSTPQTSISLRNRDFVVAEAPDRRQHSRSQFFAGIDAEWVGGIATERTVAHGQRVRTDHLHRQGGVR